MQGTVLFTGMFLGAAVLTSAWSKPSTELSASEDIWLKVDALLQEASDAPLSIELQSVMNRMSVVRDDDGNLSLMTGIEVHLAEVDAYLLALGQALRASEQSSGGDPRSSSTLGSAEVEIVALDGDAVQILLYEPVGSGLNRIIDNPGERLAA